MRFFRTFPKTTRFQIPFELRFPIVAVVSTTVMALMGIGRVIILGMLNKIIFFIK